jgi:DNA (cytosine-5)-methyltransferase 1
VRRLLPIEAERLQGFPEGWTLPPGLAINDPDKVDTLRYNALGNAVTVPVAQWLAARISRHLNVGEAAKPKRRLLAVV